MQEDRGLWGYKPTQEQEQNKQNIEAEDHETNDVKKPVIMSSLRALMREKQGDEEDYVKLVENMHR